MSLMLWIFFLVLLLFGVHMVLAPAHRSVALKLLFLPGCLAATVLKVLFALLARAQIKKVLPPWKSGEPVELGPSKIPYLGSVLASALPVAGALALLVCLHAELAPSVRLLSELPELKPSTAEAASSVADCAVGVVAGTQCFAEACPSSPNPGKVAAFFYLAAALLLYAAPSFREFRHTALVACVLLVPVALIDWLGLVPGFLSRGWFLQRSWSPVAHDAVALLLSLVFLVATLALMLRIVSLLRAGKGKPPGGGGGKGKG